MEWRQLRLNGGGTLRFREEGTLIRFEAFDADDGRGLYKIYVCGAQGKMLLGTVCPGQSGPELVRRISRNQLERCGCWPITGAERILSYSFDREPLWRQDAHPERLVGDVVLRESLECRKMLLKRRKDGFCLAAGFDPGRPFPLTPLFCLASVCTVEGRNCAVFWFDREGNPVMPYNESICGENSGRT